MDQNILTIIIVIAVILIAFAIWASIRKKRTDHLRDQFGEEYDRTLEAQGGRDAAEANLEAREERVKTLDIRPLTSEEHARFADEWREVKSVFVDSPTEAVLHADRMLATMMTAKGFPMADFDHRFEDLTVNHADVARHYRAGHDIADRHNTGETTTEDMRQAMKHYEALYDRLVSDAERGASPAATTATSGRAESGATSHRPTPVTDTMNTRATGRPANDGTVTADLDGDGHADTRGRDLDGDGDADIVRRDRDGDGHADRVEIRRD
ncbi:hypothetical protein [Aurantiacibacter spongiae]|uniref:Secreted protein n=1 Tax=Aurantiacibacter spongiae TaxID=2488860 RepID=A0A3N5DLE2_9SPHN|nr:hypothetical protein [Aurantiacibacter spongiae]RPF71605.1 hypothetical protein EG799_08210 [Aurantiacibacter spongiae]